LEKGLDHANQRKTVLAAIALGYSSDDAWAKEALDRGLKEWHPTIKRDLAEVLRPAATRAAGRDIEILSRLVHDDDSMVRDTAGVSMIGYGSAAVPAIGRAIQEGNCDKLVEALGGS